MPSQQVHSRITNRRGWRRSPLKREKDRARVAELHAQGKKQWEIAYELGCSLAQVGYDLRQIKKAWRDSSIRNFDEAKGQEIAKLEELERTYWKGYLDTYDYHFLDGIRGCIDRRIKLLGLDATKKIDITYKIRELAKESGMDPDEAVREAQSIIAAGWLNPS